MHIHAINRSGAKYSNHLMLIITVENVTDCKSATSGMIFATREGCDKIRRFAAPKNEENFDRLERELLTFPE